MAMAMGNERIVWIKQCPRLSNVVLTGRLLHPPLNAKRLVDIHLYSEYTTQYKPRRFPGLILNLRRSKRKQQHHTSIPTHSPANAKLTIFASGALTITGTTNPMLTITRVESILCNLLHHPHSEISFAPWKLQNIVGYFSVKLPAPYSDNVTKLVQKLQTVVTVTALSIFKINYEPELAPAIHFRPTNRQTYPAAICIQMHHSGQAIISGCIEVNQLFDCVTEFVRYLNTSLLSLT